MRMAIAAPKPAPGVIPRIWEDTSGFLNIPCRAAPDTESPAPTMPAARIRVNRISRMILEGFVPEADEPVSAVKMYTGEIVTGPVPSAIKADTIRRNKRTR
jgi:hypothetical protein